MDDLIQAITSNDFVKAKQCFEESMKSKVDKVLENRKIEISKSVFVEGEVPDTDEDEEDEEE